MYVVELTVAEKKQLKNFFSKYGRIKDCAKNTGLDRNTISNVLSKGQGMNVSVDKIREYYNANTATAA